MIFPNTIDILEINHFEKNWNEYEKHYAAATFPIIPVFAAMGLKIATAAEVQKSLNFFHSDMNQIFIIFSYEYVWNVGDLISIQNVGDSQLQHILYILAP